MRSSILATGLKINLVKEDKSKENLECKVNDLNIRVFLNIVDTVEESGFMEEPGFHIKCYPDVELLKSKEVHIYLSRKRWEDLTTQYDREAMGGYFGSRCRYDRCEFNYWDEDLIPNIR